ncbi:MAG: hypothetical protein IPM24_14040 [Bryobacterales bacterium]|nr:hypothetical protein [Bryobacterales bacterium]
MHYLITFTTYGSWLHGDERGSRSRALGPVSPNRGWVLSEQKRLRAAPFRLDGRTMSLVRDAIVAIASRRAWLLIALHVRPCHVHLVAAAEAAGIAVLRAAKAAASTSLNRHMGAVAPRWTRYGHVAELRGRAAVERAIAYVLDQQGARTAWYAAR